MNIFFLHKNPVIAAQMLGDADVRRQIKQSAQMLSTAHYMLGIEDMRLPKPTHRKHPATMWVMNNRANYTWLYEHFKALLTEYEFRFDRPHAFKEHLSLLEMMPQGIEFRHHRETNPPCLVPVDLKAKTRDWDAVVTAYRAFYNRDCRGSHRWTERPKPEWIIDEEQLKAALAEAEEEAKTADAV